MIPVENKKSEKSFVLVPAGNHVARIYSIIHIGTTLEETTWGPKELNKIRITWELPNELHEFKEGEGEKPMVISAEYNLSFNEKSNLRKFIDGLYGSDYLAEGETLDVETLLGKVCMVNVQHKSSGDRTYANVVAVTPLPKGFKEPEPVNAQFVLNYTDKWVEAKFEKLPDFIKSKMMETDEYKSITGSTPKPLEEDDGTNIPF